VLLAGAVEVNALGQGALQQFTQRMWIKHPPFQLGGGHFATEPLPPQLLCYEKQGKKQWLVENILGISVFIFLKRLISCQSQIF